MEEIYKPALTGVTSKPLPRTATGLRPAARGNPMANPGTHSPDPWVSPGAEFKQTRMPAAAGQMQDKGIKLRFGPLPPAQVPTMLL